MIVVSDTSCLYYPVALGIVHLFPALYGKVIVPGTVFQELTVGAVGFPEVAEVLTAPWLEVRSADSSIELTELLELLDPGEAEAIALSTSIRADLLLMDEEIGRRIAKRQGLQVTGLLGVILDGKRAGLVPAVKPLIEKLRKETNFHIAQSLADLVIRQAGESP